MKSRVKHVNARGLLVELFKYEYDDFINLSGSKQINLFTVESGKTRAGHKHPNTNETWIIITGTGTLRLEYPDGMKIAVEYCIVTNEDDALVIHLPQGTGHDITADTFTLVVYDMDRLYDPDDRDKEPWEWGA